MVRFYVTESPKHHAPISHVISLLERISLTDKLEVRKEIGGGYFVTVIEGEEIRPRED